MGGAMDSDLISYSAHGSNHAHGGEGGEWKTRPPARNDLDRLVLNLLSPSLVLNIS